MHSHRMHRPGEHLANARDTSGSVEAAVRARLDVLAQAIRDKDIDTLIGLYAPECVVFDVFPPLHVRGAEAYRQNLERWFALLKAPVVYEIRDLDVTSCGQTAICRRLSHVSVTRKSGIHVDYWVRVTTQLEERGGQWLVIHDHISLPAHMLGD
jgi:uncharacterized protein (TIGR02246 family)